MARHSVQVNAVTELINMDIGTVKHSVSAASFYHEPMAKKELIVLSADLKREDGTPENGLFFKSVGFRWPCERPITINNIRHFSIGLYNHYFDKIISLLLQYSPYFGVALNILYALKSFFSGLGIILRPFQIQPVAYECLLHKISPISDKFTFIVLLVQSYQKYIKSSLRPSVAERCLCCLQVQSQY